MNFNRVTEDIELRDIDTKGKVRIAVYSVMLSAVMLIGRHMHIIDAYDGLLTENYFTPFNISDVLFLFLAAVVIWFTAILVHILSIRLSKMPLQVKNVPLLKSALWMIPVMMLMWLPYFLKYYPGFVFQDTMNSIEQALELTPLNNRNPLLYTLFIRFCILCTGGFQTHDVTAACAVYSICQMLYVSACLSYMIHAVTERFNRIWQVLLTILYGVSPYIAALNIAMWKDPVFSASVVAYSVLIFRFVSSKGTVFSSKKWKTAFLFMSILILFWRNNGFCAILGLLAYGIIAIVHERKDKALCRKLVRITAFSGVLLLLWGTVVVFGYRMIGVGTPKEEMAGLMINQMARVAACDGNLSEEEEEYLNSMLPLELYPEVYRPCCVDQLKWDGHFNYDALKGSLFLKTWFSVGLKNPRLYIEAWAMESYGFWTVNRPEINTNTLNISWGGTPFNFISDSVDFGDYTIRFNSLIEIKHNVFPCDSWSIPVGIINWLLVFILISLKMRRKSLFAIALSPQIGISAGLILQTPIYYLPRYGLAAQLLIPLYILILLKPDFE